MKEMVLFLVFVILLFGCKVGRPTIPSRQQVESAIEGYKSWSIGIDEKIVIVDIYYFNSEAYVFGTGKVCNVIAYCKSNRGDTIALVDNNCQKQNIQIQDIKISNQELDKNDFIRFFNESYILSDNFVRIVNAVDSVYLVELD